MLCANAGYQSSLYATDGRKKERKKKEFFFLLFNQAKIKYAHYTTTKKNITNKEREKGEKPLVA